MQNLSKNNYIFSSSPFFRRGWERSLNGARYLASMACLPLAWQASYTPEYSIWLSVDPMADKYPSTSPFTYCLNNPVILVDPDGRKIVCTSKEGQEKLLRIMVEAFGDEGYNFCFNSNNELIYTGGTYNKYLDLRFYSDFTDEELEVAIPLLGVMNSTDVVKVIFERDKDTKKRGGEYTATKYDRNKEEKIVVDPDENPILVHYIKIDSENSDRTLFLMNRNNQVIIRSKDIVVHSVDIDNKGLLKIHFSALEFKMKILIPINILLNFNAFHLYA